MENLYLLEAHSLEREVEALAQARRHRLFQDPHIARQPWLRLRLRDALVALADRILPRTNGAAQPLLALSEPQVSAAPTGRRPSVRSCPTYRVSRRSPLAAGTFRQRRRRAVRP
jgi:hypothetical protein